MLIHPIIGTSKVFIGVSDKSSFIKYFETFLSLSSYIMRFLAGRIESILNDQISTHFILVFFCYHYDQSSCINLRYNTFMTSYLFLKSIFPNCPMFRSTSMCMMWTSKSCASLTPLYYACYLQ